MIVIEIDTATNGSLFFAPLQEAIRGRMDPMRFKDREERLTLIDEYPQGVPGQRIAFDEQAGTASLVEPLHEPQNAAVREKLAAKRYSFAPHKREISAATVEQTGGKPTWLYWLNRAVESGHARLVSGTLPAKIEGRIRKQFLRPEDDAKAEKEKRERTLERQKLAAALAMMTEKQRAEYDRILASLDGE
jgi:hypothetical protein